MRENPWRDGEAGRIFIWGAGLLLTYFAILSPTAKVRNGFTINHFRSYSGGSSRDSLQGGKDPHEQE